MPGAPTHLRLPAQNVQSLAWHDDVLVDWVGGISRHHLDGAVDHARVGYSYRFDSAISVPEAGVAVIYERLGTKGLVIAGQSHREINRSFYHADDYEYPICLWAGADGRVLLAHCPEHYNQIEIEDAITGERLTDVPDRTPADFFHSRLQVNSGGTRMLSAGWVWHPWDAVCFYDLAECFENPTNLDTISGHTAQAFHVGLVEEASACWQTDDRLLISGGSDEEDPEEAMEQGDVPRLRPNGVIAYDIPSQTCVRSVELDQPAGRMMPVGEDHIVAFYDHPRLISLLDGKVTAEWPDIPTGPQTSSIVRGQPHPPPMALDSMRRRFAVFVGDEIHVVTV